MRKTAIYILLLMAVTIYSCQDESSTLGNKLVETSFKNVAVDTCTVLMSTLYADSVETLGDSICQLGHYKDNTWGEVSSSYYAEYSLASFTPTENHVYSLDSITITLAQTGNYWGDTLSIQHINAYQLKNELSLLSDESYYNHSRVKIQDTPLFNFSFYSMPGKKRVKEFRMPDSFGQTLLKDIVAEKDFFYSQDKFKMYFHGLAFVPDKSDQCITGFKVDSLYMTLYYKDASENISRTLQFSVNKSYAFTGLDDDYTGTDLEQLKGGFLNAVPSTKLNHRAYLQGLTGIYSEIEFPHLNNLLEQGDIVSIESAVLYLYPAQGSYGKVNSLPSELRLYTVNENNVLESQVYESSGTTVQTGNLVVDQENLNTCYSFDITSFLQENLGTSGSGKKKLLLNLTDNDFKNTFKQVIFANDKDKDRQVKLAVRYKAYTKQ